MYIFVIVNGDLAISVVIFSVGLVKFSCMYDLFISVAYGYENVIKFFSK